MCQVCEIPSAVDVIESKRCFERQQTGTCNCLRRKGRGKIKMVVNPCQVADDLVSQIYNGTVDADELVTWLSKHRCNDVHCNHRPCIKVDNVIDQIKERRERRAAA